MLSCNIGVYLRYNNVACHKMCVCVCVRFMSKNALLGQSSSCGCDLRKNIWQLNGKNCKGLIDMGRLNQDSGCAWDQNVTSEIS